MSLSWILIALPLAALLYFGWIIACQKPIPHLMPLAPASPSPAVAWWKSLQPGRTVKWISSAKLKRMTRPFEDVIVVDLRLRDIPEPAPLPEADFLVNLPLLRISSLPDWLPDRWKAAQNVRLTRSAQEREFGRLP
jgi:hypothetical protein